ncbi:MULTISPECIES: SdpI family protein [Microbacterium]|jgi:uncharacterized membrane protein|uniref:SdpI family protein n=1 Tax=Microbacterium TaxID=33882 RepID=UPI0023D9DB9B|nr:MULTISPECIES: SdpI family protein [Microbacterium]MDF2048019.1 SdpI family protein [Microbacterium sp. Kw_RZR3]MDF2916981.1 putative integral rane protein [Microbacterium sp.]MDQ1076460.1 putative membrane protein [Microbacterium sp. SORGH_AS_0969]MDQ1116696.1 putative membrane protein [Microbacterium testaceum]
MIGALVTSTVAMVAVAALAFWTAQRGAAGTLPRNDFIGIRTGATRASDEAWIAAHRAGAVDLAWSGAGALLTALGPWAALIVPTSLREFVIVVAVVVGLVVLLGFSLRAAVVGGRAARELTEGR